MYGFEKYPNAKQIESGVANYRRYQAAWDAFSKRWNQKVKEGRTNPYGPDHFTLDEAYTLLNEVQDLRERALFIDERFHGIGSYNPGTERMETPYSSRSAFEQIATVQDTLHLFIKDATHGHIDNRATQLATTNDLA